MTTFKPLYMNHFQSSDIEAAWRLILALKQEGAEITFTDYTAIEDLTSWVNSSTQLVYTAKDAAGNLLALVRGKREDSYEKRHVVFLTAATAIEARGRGLAASLTEYALKEMIAEGVQLARIYVYSDNLPSLNAVKKLGFECAGKVVAHHKCPHTGQFIDDVIFHKWLI